MFEFTHTEDGSKGAFLALSNGQRAGGMTYSRKNASTRIVDRTGVSAGFEGHNPGRQLVVQGVELACRNNQKIMPLFPFARALFERTPEYADVRFRQGVAARSFHGDF